MTGKQPLSGRSARGKKSWQSVTIVAIVAGGIVAITLTTIFQVGEDAGLIPFVTAAISALAGFGSAVFGADLANKARQSADDARAATEETRAALQGSIMQQGSGAAPPLR